MVQKVTEFLVDDLDGTPATETVQFALDGTEYEIDLSGEHAAALRAAFRPYAEKGRKTRLPRRAVKRQSREDLPDIREWARARGHGVKDRGRVPARIVAEYDTLMAARSAG